MAKNTLKTCYVLRRTGGLGYIIAQLHRAMAIGFDHFDHQGRANEISGNYLMSLLGAAMNFDDPIDTFGQIFVTKGGRWYQRHSLPALDTLFEQQKFMGDPEARKKVVWDMDTMAMNDAAYLVLLWPEFYHVRWNFVKGWTITPNLWSTNARMDTVWLDLPELPHSR